MSTPSSLLSLTDFRDRFNAELATVLAEQIRAAHDLDPEYGRLVDTLAELINRGGKRLRPYLVYLSYVGSNGPTEHVDALIRASAAQELYHTAWLIHDDLIDRDLVRYGGPNVAGRYRTYFADHHTPDAHHLANAMALLAGDLSANLAAELLLASPFPPSAQLAALQANARANAAVFGGETLDVLMPTLDLATVTPDRLTTLSRAKTAHYSFRAPLEVGALLANAPATTVAAIPAVAEPLGVAFQLADDLLGTYGNEQTLGKSVLTDLREGKRTLLFITARANADPANRIRLDQLAGNPEASNHDLAEIRTLYETTGARASVEQTAERYIQQALTALPSLSYTSPVAAELTRLAHYLIDRPS